MAPSGLIGAGIVVAVAVLSFVSLARVVVTVVGGRLVRGDRSDERPVLPSHYSSLLHHDRGHYPGHCPDCGTDNEPGYRYCQQCARTLPSSSDFGGDQDLGSIFGE